MSRFTPLKRLASVPAFFALRILSGLFLLKLSAVRLPVSGFAAFSQLLMFLALLNVLTVGGAQNGLVRQAAAAEDPRSLGRSQAAAFAIWACALPLLALPVLAAAGPIAKALVGSAQWAGAVIAIALAALAAGPGQIWCGILTGRTRVASSLAAQALGLTAGTAAAALMILRGQPAAAAIAFAGGGLVTLLAAFLLARPLRIPLLSPRRAWPEVRTLLRYSAALALTTGFTALVLFALRSRYRDAFGGAQLGYWMAANRISDMSTQLLGLFMIQFFVPHLAMTENPAARRTLMLRGLAAGALAMGGILAVFTLGADLLVRAFLSAAYLPAIGAIKAYMLGDMLRVWPSLAMYAAFARGQPGRYAAIEMSALSLMAVITLTLTALGQPQAPLAGYVGAYGVLAVLVSLAFLRRGGLAASLDAVSDPAKA